MAYAYQRRGTITMNRKEKMLIITAAMITSSLIGLYGGFIYSLTRTQKPIVRYIEPVFITVYLKKPEDVTKIIQELTKRNEVLPDGAQSEYTKR